jgi:hypothetical protein
VNGPCCHFCLEVPKGSWRVKKTINHCLEVIRWTCCVLCLLFLLTFLVYAVFLCFAPWNDVPRRLDYSSQINWNATYMRFSGSLDTALFCMLDEMDNVPWPFALILYAFKGFLYTVWFGPQMDAYNKGFFVVGHSIGSIWLFYRSTITLSLWWIKHILPASVAWSIKQQKQDGQKLNIDEQVVGWFFLGRAV